MAEDLHIPVTEDRAERYASLLPQIEALVKGETDRVANLANIMAALKEGLGFFWVGVYLVQDKELVLGPFQGPVACTRIRRGKGVCGAAWERDQVLIVPDVDQFPGHIACSSLSRSEIVLPLHNAGGEVIGVLDVDSTTLADFSETDAVWLKKVAALISTVCH